MLCPGDAATPSSAATKQRSLVISRNISARLGVQTLTPARLLYGVIPDALLEDYVFGQDQGGGSGTSDAGGGGGGGGEVFLREYKTAEAEARESGKALDMLICDVLPKGRADSEGFGHADAVGTIRRVAGVRQGQGVCQEVVPRCDVDGGGHGRLRGAGGARDGEDLVLLNSQFAPPDSPLGQVVTHGGTQSSGVWVVRCRV